MISLVFIRHGATKGNLEKRYIGRTDEPLCETGVEQSLRLRECNFPKEYIFVSPMKRTVQTAELIFPECDYVTIDDFRETDFGAFEGKTAMELADDKEYRAWVDSMCLNPIPSGEDVAEFKARCTKAFGEIVNSLPDNSEATFVVHGGVIMAILESFAEEGTFYDYHIGNGEYVICEFENNSIKRRR